jgi:hypothetical protein
MNQTLNKGSQLPGLRKPGGATIDRGNLVGEGIEIIPIIVSIYLFIT